MLGHTRPETLPRYATLDPNPQSRGNINSESIPLTSIAGSSTSPVANADSSNAFLVAYANSPEMRVDIPADVRDGRRSHSGEAGCTGGKIATRVIGATLMAGGVVMMGYGGKMLTTKEGNSDATDKNNSSHSNSALSKNQTIGAALIAVGAVVTLIGTAMAIPKTRSCIAATADVCCSGPSYCCYL